MTLKDYIKGLRAKLLGASDDEKSKIEAQIRDLESVEPESAPTQASAPAPAPAPAPQVQVPVIPTGTIPAGADAAALSAMISEAVTTAVAPLRAELDASKVAREALTQQLNEQRSAAFKTQVSTYLDDAVKAGKIAADKRADMERTILEKPETWDTTRAVLDAAAPNPILARQAATQAASQKPANGQPPANGQQAANGQQKTPSAAKYETRMGRSANPKMMAYIESQQAEA